MHELQLWIRALFYTWSYTERVSLDETYLATLMENWLAPLGRLQAVQRYVEKHSFIRQMHFWTSSKDCILCFWMSPQCLCAALMSWITLFPNSYEPDLDDRDELPDWRFSNDSSPEYCDLGEKGYGGIPHFLAKLVCIRYWKILTVYKSFGCEQEVHDFLDVRKAPGTEKIQLLISQWSIQCWATLLHTPYESCKDLTSSAYSDG